MRTEIDFYFDFLSPYAYLARHKLVELAGVHKVSLNYKPIDLGRAKLAIGNNGPANRHLPVKLSYLTSDLKRWAQRYGVALGGIKNHNSERLNIGTFFCTSEEECAVYVRETYHLLWGIGAAPDDESIICRIAQRMGWNEQRLLDFTCSARGMQCYESSTKEAIAKGVFGVPMMSIGDQMWWGNDRVFMVDEYLASQLTSANQDAWRPD